jgi:hypothetical protein
MPIPESDCNCTEADGTLQGQKGTTIWTANDVTLQAISGTVTWSFTDTQPNCYTGTHACLLIYDVVTTQNAPSDITAIQVYRFLNDYPMGPAIHSKVANHNVTDVFDLTQVKNWLQVSQYHSGGLNTIHFTNQSPIDVQIKNIRILRAYGLSSLAYEKDHPGCSGSADTGTGGNIDYSRQDYPCNLESFGNRFSFYHKGPDDTQGTTIVPGGYKTWSFTHPEAPNHIDEYACLFNFNNIALENDSAQADIHYYVNLNGVTIADYWQCNLANLSQFPGIDLAKYQSYNRNPGDTNIVELHNDSNGDRNLILKDGNSGRVDIYRFYKTANLCQDDFSSATMNAFIWNDPKLSTNYGTTSQANGQLQVTVPYSGSTWTQAGYITKCAYDTHALYGSSQQGFEASIDVATMGSLEEVDLLISCDSIVTNDDPAYLANWYRVLKTTYNSSVYVQNRLYGGTVSNKFVGNWNSQNGGKLKIKVSTGSIALYEDDILRYAEPFALPSSNCHIYAYTSSRFSGTGAFDNYSLIPAQIVREDFNNGNYNNWTVDSGNWVLNNGSLQSLTINSHVHYSTSFPVNRHVRADIQTVAAGGNAWDVPWLYVKEQDGYNNVYALIHTNGYVELAMFYQGNKSMWVAASSLNPFNLHSLAVSIIGINAKVWVDGALYIDVNDNNFANLSGYVGLYTSNSLGQFDNVAIFQ